MNPTGLYWLGARYYNPMAGRFLTPNPLGHSSSMDLYSFCSGDPLNNFDPTGRFGKSVVGNLKPLALGVGDVMEGGSYYKSYLNPHSGWSEVGYDMGYVAAEATKQVTLFFATEGAFSLMARGLALGARALSAEVRIGEEALAGEAAAGRGAKGAFGMGVDVAEFGAADSRMFAFGGGGRRGRDSVGFGKSWFNGFIGNWHDLANGSSGVDPERKYAGAGETAFLSVGREGSIGGLNAGGNLGIAGETAWWRNTKWTPMEFEGRRVYTGPIDLGVPDVVDSKFVNRAVRARIDAGASNLDLMKEGLAPIGPDGRPVNLHHVLGEEPGPMVELEGSTHSEFQGPLHGLIENGRSFRNTPGLEYQYGQFRARYWKWRAGGGLGD